MAQIVESLSKQSSFDVSSQSTSSDESTEGFKMSAQITIDQGHAQFVLESGATGFSCNGTFSAPGVPDTKLSFSEDDGQLRIAPGVKLQGTFGLFVLNMDSILSQKGILSMFFVTQDRDKQDFAAFFTTPQSPDQTLGKMPDLQGSGWGGWSGPAE